MQQIADKVGVHVTTVSRAVDDKWIQTPRGIFPLKRFFVGGTVSADGEEVAWDTVRMKLQEIIDKEDKANPLSDDDLVTELCKHGLTVARRTVTKYRKAMNIPSSRQRRDWTAIAREPAAKENGSAAPGTNVNSPVAEPSAVHSSAPASLHNSAPVANGQIAGNDQPAQPHHTTPHTGDSQAPRYDRQRRYLFFSEFDLVSCCPLFACRARVK